jgi:FAD/FMN-containing dehydrogenase
MTAPTEATLARLKVVVGSDGFLDQPTDTAPFCKSWRDDWPGRVPLVLRPASTAEVAALVRICAETNTAIVPQGGRTGLTGASQPHDTGTEVIITTDRMRRVRDLDLSNDTLAVDAGVVLQTIQDLARQNDRFFPMSLGAEGSCHSAEH